MAYKTIGLAHDAYRRLKEEKRPGESFSDVVRRLTGASALRGLIGTLTDEDAEDFYRRRAERKKKDKEAMHRMLKGAS